jgi:S-adenosylmethionine decarboxylase
VDAYGCDPAALRSLDALQALFERLIADLQLQPVAPPVWHQFPDAGGITGVVVLSESHLTAHTFPERGFAALNLYCCRPRHAWAWSDQLTQTLGATDVRVTTVRRPGL